MSDKILYFSNLYVGEGITEKKLDKIKRNLEVRPLLSNVYLVTLSQNKDNQLDIFQARQLVQRFYSTHPVCIVGIANTYDDAIALVEEIAKECLKERGDCALKEFLDGDYDH